MATLDEIRLQQLLQPFENQNTGVMSTNSALPFINTGQVYKNLQNQNLVDEIIKENMQKNIGSFINAPQDYYPSDIGGITELAPLENLGIDTSYGVASEPDVEQVESLTKKEPSCIAKLLQFLMPGSFLRNLPQESPEIQSIKNFYRQNYGLTPTGQVASGIMQGYNPVYGGFLNMISGGRFGTPAQYGLADAARRRIENIATRKAPQTAASRAKIAALQKFAERDTISRARQAAPDVYRSAERQGFTGPGGGFSTSGREGAFSSKSGRGRQDY